MEENKKELIITSENPLLKNTQFSSHDQMMMISEINTFSNLPNSALFDILADDNDEDDHEKISSFGFFNPEFIINSCASSTFDDLMALNQNIIVNNNNNNVPLESPSQSRQLVSQTLTSPAPEYSEVVNTPATPNSCSISSSSTDERKKSNNNNNGSVDEDDDDVENQDKTKKELLKAKKKKQKRERDPRFAFMTKSDVDHLDDGFRWRKYGQKAVKNSPFPRSYYRCTSTACGVKKRVERSCEDPSIVVTTYEGTHTHPCPITPRGTFGILPETATFRGGLGGAFGGAGGGGVNSSSHLFMPQQMLHYQQKTPPPQQQQQQPNFHNLAPQLSFISTTSTNNNPTFSPPLKFQERPFCPSASSSERDHGLLQDMLPSKMLKEPKEE